MLLLSAPVVEGSGTIVDRSPEAGTTQYAYRHGFHNVKESDDAAAPCEARARCLPQMCGDGQKSPRGFAQILRLRGST